MKYEVLDFSATTGEILGMWPGRPDDLPICPKCDCPDFKSLVGIPTGIDLGDEAGVGRIYPYYDRNLKCRVSNAKHRKQICKARGLIPVDGDMTETLDRQVSADERKNAEIKRKYDNLKDMYDHHPDFREHRELMDKGFYEDKQREAAERSR